MKKKLVFMIFLIPQVLNAQWHQVFYNEEYFNAIIDITFISSDTGYALDIHTIYQTTDGGNTWEMVYENDDIVLSSIAFGPDSVGYVLGNMPSNALISKDYGNTWNMVDFGANGAITDSWCLNNDTCIATKSSGYILKTTNGWNSYEEELAFLCNYTSVFFIDADTGYLGGYECTSFCNIYKTTDGAQTWDCMAYFDLDVYDVQKLFFPSPQTGYAIVSLYKVAKSIDYGSSWEIIHGPLDPESIFDLHFLNDSTGYVVGDLGTGDELNEYFPYIVKTIDGGTTWTEEYVLDSVSRLLCITCLDNGNCFAGTGDGKIITNKEFDPTIQINETNNFISLNVYPNPASNYLKIGLTPKDNIESIITYNLLGEKMPVYFTNESVADISFLLAGIYITEVILEIGKISEMWIKR